MNNTVEVPNIASWPRGVPVHVIKDGKLYIGVVS